MQPIIEVSTEYDEPFLKYGICCIYHNGVCVSTWHSFDAAMTAAFPNYERWDGRGFEAQIDNWCE